MSVSPLHPRRPSVSPLCSVAIAACAAFASLSLASASNAAAQGTLASAPPHKDPPAGVLLASTAGDVGWAGAEISRRGVVQIERGGKIVGLGSVLGHDGRVLTALSIVGNGDADVRYIDGSVAHAKLGHKDAEWDLALLVPQTGTKWTDGLSASEGDPGGAILRAFAPHVAGAKDLRPRVTPAPFQGRTDVHATSGTELEGALSIQARGASLGSPVVDADGSVLAVLVRACRDAPPPSMAAMGSPARPLSPGPKGSVALLPGPGAPGATTAPAAPCSAVMIGAPVRAVRDFLVRTPSTAAAPSPWLGIVGEAASLGGVRGVRVMAVAPGSPADKAGLQASTDPVKADLVTAVDGIPVDSPDRLSEEIAKHPIGAKTPLLLFKDGRLKEATVTLRAAP